MLFPSLSGTWGERVYSPGESPRGPTHEHRAQRAGGAPAAPSTLRPTVKGARRLCDPAQHTDIAVAPSPHRAGLQAAAPEPPTSCAPGVEGPALGAKSPQAGDSQVPPHTGRPQSHGDPCPRPSWEAGEGAAPLSQQLPQVPPLYLRPLAATSLASRRLPWPLGLHPPGNYGGDPKRAPQLPLGMPTLEGGAEDEPRHSLQGLGEQRLPRRHPPPRCCSGSSRAQAALTCRRVGQTQGMPPVLLGARLPNRPSSEQGRRL